MKIKSLICAMTLMALSIPAIAGLTLDNRGNSCRKEIIMEQYTNLGGDSGVFGYKIGDDFIRVQFSVGSIYLYTYASAGFGDIEKMKRLAQFGEGLNAYINTTVRKRYVCKER